MYEKATFFVLLSSVMNAQTITFKGCIPLLMIKILFLIKQEQILVEEIFI